MELAEYDVQPEAWVGLCDKMYEVTDKGISHITKGLLAQWRHVFSSFMLYG